VYKSADAVQVPSAEYFETFTKTNMNNITDITNIDGE